MTIKTPNDTFCSDLAEYNYKGFGSEILWTLRESTASHQVGLYTFSYPLLWAVCNKTPTDNHSSKLVWQEVNTAALAFCSHLGKELHT